MNWRSLLHAMRFVRVLITLGPPLARLYKADRLPRQRILTDEEAQSLKEVLEALGPTFIKLGQMLSCHVDLLPPEVLQALSELLDEVKPAPFSQVKTIIDEELGEAAKAIVDYDEEPIGSASIAQVYRGLLADGRSVAIKVRRPGLEAQVARDLRIMRHLSKWLPSPSRLPFTLEDLVAELALQMQHEMDFLREASSMARFRAKVAEGSDIIVPQPISQLCSKRVLTMTYHQGVRLDKAIPSLSMLAKREMASKLIQIYSIQFIEAGMVHADPHAGNLLVNEDGQLIVLDFGAMVFIPEAMRRKFLRLLEAVLRADAERAHRVFLSLGFLPPSHEAVVLQSQMYDMLEDYLSRPVGRVSLSEIFEALTTLSAQHGFKIPRPFLYLVRALSTLEGHLMALDPASSSEEVLKKALDEVANWQMAHPLEAAMDVVKEQAERVRSFWLAQDIQPPPEKEGRLNKGRLLLGICLVAMTPWLASSQASALPWAIAGFLLALMLLF
ncbi:MAG: AarF/ABC1/UbiB kinase family protein [Synergistales bacterium]|nr:AarF/ABC1/UbiB kinase family protein [Synergistales bacterium]